MVDVLQEAIQTVLVADSTLMTALGGGTVWYALAPGTVNPPYVITNFQTGREDNETLARAETQTYLVKGVASSLGSASTLAKAIDDVMHDGTLSVAGFTAFEVKRVSIVKFIEVKSNGQTVGHSGGEYQIRLDPD